MKKNWCYLVIIVIIIGLVGFALDRSVPARPVHAASENHLALVSAGPVEKEPVAPARSAQPVVYVVVGLVCVLFGVIAVSPLLISDPVKMLHEANKPEK